MQPRDRNHEDQSHGNIGTALQPLVAKIYKARGCNILLNRSAVLGGNVANNLRSQVILAIDAKIPSIPLRLEVLASDGALNHKMRDVPKAW
jgi:hypothetical protein